MSKEEILTLLTDYIGDDTSEAAIKLLEVVSDNFNDEIDEKIEEINRLKDEIEDLKRKYIERFTKVEIDNEDDSADVEEVEEKTSFEELFTEGE